MSSAVDDVVRALRAATDDGKTLRQGVVDSVGSGVCAVKWGNNATASPNQRHLKSYYPVVGETVWGVRDENVIIVIGPVNPPTIHVVGAASEPAFEHSWAAYGGGYFAPRFWKDAAGIVHLSGLAASGTLGQSIFTLPSGFRPPNHVMQNAVANAVPSWVQITNGGSVVSAGGIGSNAWFSLDGASFPTF